MSERTTKLRCAVYTRKSHEEGLDQAFNSLDAQREACEAYIASQAGLGWRLVKDRYDDGGLSGGTMERPALQRLLDEVRQGRVDVIVVYKIDRLTRSLMDFARMVEIFDRAKVSFVSVTQQFNTTTSMGRLTLNVLLSFAQFEREVTAERIRDKIAASKRKGMWMGGTVPLGYQALDRKLVVEPKAAIAVRHLFERYLQLGSVPRLVAELNAERDRRTMTPLTAADQLSSDDEPARRRDVVSSGASDVDHATDAGAAAALLLSADTGQGRRRPSVRVGSGKLYYILSNPIYVGRVRHGETLHAGEHDAIVAQDLFDAVQARLAEQAQRPRGSTPQPDVHLLASLIIDGAGDPCRPTHATKGGKRYRYYVSKALLKTDGADRGSGLRLPAREIEILVISELHRLLGDAALLTRWLQTAGQDGLVEAALRRATQLRDELSDAKATDRLRRLLRAVIERVMVSSTRVELHVDLRALIALLLAADGSRPSSTRRGRAVRTCRSKAGQKTGSLADPMLDDDAASAPDIDPDAPSSKMLAGDPSDMHTISLPMTMRRRGLERRLVIEGQEAASARPDRPLIEMIARAHLYLRATTVEGLDRRQVAMRYDTRAEDVGRILPLAFLSPRITDAILTGRQPSDLSVIRMARQTDLPLGWTQQSDELGF